MNHPEIERRRTYTEDKVQALRGRLLKRVGDGSRFYRLLIV